MSVVALACILTSPRLPTFSRAVSVIASILVAVLFVTELSCFLTIETVDKLDVDVAHPSGIAINVDIYFPSLPCDDFMVDVVDETGMQQLHVTDNLSKMRMDRHGTPIDVPLDVDWAHTVAPAFRHRKVRRLAPRPARPTAQGGLISVSSRVQVMNVLESISASLRETLLDVEADKENEEHETDGVSHEAHESHRRHLAHRAQVLENQLEVLSLQADPDHVKQVAQMSQRTVTSIKVGRGALRLRPSLLPGDALPRRPCRAGPNQGGEALLRALFGGDLQECCRGGAGAG